jgi:putative tryptophan/tyrosine transport system substrate-binding protein
MWFSIKKGKGMKKLIAVSLVALMALVSTGFGADTISVGVAWDAKSSRADRTAQGLQEYLKENAPNIQLEICKETGTGDKYAEVVKRLQKEKKAVVLLLSAGVSYLSKNTPSTPSFVGACNHPGKLGLIKNSEAPEGNVTGVTYFLPAISQFEIFKSIFPDMKSVLLILEKGHAGVPVDQAETKAACEKFKLEYKEVQCESKEQIIQAVKDNAGKVSLFLIGNEKLIYDNAADVIANAGKTPVITYPVEPAVKAGAVCGFSADDVKLGKMLGESLVDVLVKGKPIKEVPLKFDAKPKLYINPDAAEKLGVKIPFTILKAAEIVKSK